MEGNRIYEDTGSNGLMSLSVTPDDSECWTVEVVPKVEWERERTSEDREGWW